MNVLRNGVVVQAANPAQLKRCRLLIRAGIPVVIRSIEEDYLIQRLRERDAKAFNQWFSLQCEFGMVQSCAFGQTPTRSQFIDRLRQLARDSGIKSPPGNES
jgi:hypothetical protein